MCSVFDCNVTEYHRDTLLFVLHSAQNLLILIFTEIRIYISVDCQAYGCFCLFLFFLNTSEM